MSFNIFTDIFKVVTGGGIYFRKQIDKSNFKVKPSVIFSLFIFFILVLPLSVKIAGKAIHIDLIQENRKLAVAPHFKEHNLKELTKMWDQYFNDRMPFRQIFLPAYIYTVESLLESYVFEYVTGKGNELFMNHAAPVVDAALQIRPYSLWSQEYLRLSAAGKYAFFYSKDIPYYQFIAPDKSTLYPDLLPFYSKWIKHEGWYKYQLDALKKANISFYDFKNVLDKTKYQQRFYDEKFDNCHWNGNALKIAYQYMAEVLSKDNPIFKAVEYQKYYSIYDTDVQAGVYGSDHTQFIKLNEEGISCSLPPEDLLLQGNPYQKICINKNKSSGTLWFFSDSYFGQTHGSNAVTPFVHNVHTYYHSHYGLSKPFTTVANERLEKYKPDAVVEEFVERMGGTIHATEDPLLRIMGDIYLKTGGFILDNTIGSRDSSNNLNIIDGEISNIQLRENISSTKRIAFSFKSKTKESSFDFRNPVEADYLGRAVIMARYSSPEETTAKVYFKTDENTNENTVEQNIIKGTNTVHITVHVKPYQKVYLRFSPGAIENGEYAFENISEVNDLRARMNKDGI